MQSKNNAIFLKKIAYGEKQLILQTYTLEEGSKAFFMHSARTKGRNKIVLPPLGNFELVTYKGKGQLERVREMHLRDKNYNLMTDLKKSSVIMFLNEVLLKSLREYHADQELYLFIVESLNDFEICESNYNNFHLKFMIELSRHMGFFPNGNFSDKGPFFDLFEGNFVGTIPSHGAFADAELSPLFNEMLLSSKRDASDVSMTNDSRRKLLSHLLDYFRIHVEKFDEVNSREILESVLT